MNTEKKATVGYPLQNVDDTDSFTKAYDKLYGSSEKKNRFRKDWLPDPLEYYRTHLHKLQILKNWAITLCPFHKDKKPSLAVNIKEGGYYCHACGVKGGDVLDFHRKLFDMDFVTATQDLGAWDDG